MGTPILAAVHDATHRRRQTVGHQIRQARHRVGISQERLALEINSTRVDVNAWENAHSAPNALHVEQLALALDEPVWFFYGGPSRSEWP